MSTFVSIRSRRKRRRASSSLSPSAMRSDGHCVRGFDRSQLVRVGELGLEDVDGAQEGADGRSEVAARCFERTELVFEGRILAKGKESRPFTAPHFVVYEMEREISHAIHDVLGGVPAIAHLQRVRRGKLSKLRILHDALVRLPGSYAES